MAAREAAVAARERRQRERLEDELRRAREAREAQLEIPVIVLRPAGWASSDRVLELRVDVDNKGRTAALELVCGVWLGGQELAGTPSGDASRALGAGESAHWVVHVPADLQPELRACLQRGEAPHPWGRFRDQVGDRHQVPRVVLTARAAA